MINQENFFETDNRNVKRKSWDIILIIAIMSIIMLGFLLATSDLVFPQSAAHADRSAVQNIPGETLPLPLSPDVNPAEPLL